MYQEILKHKWAYSLLAVGLIILTVTFMVVWPDRMLERMVIAAMALFYFVWGVLTHVHAERISRRVVLEYFGIALLAGFLLFLITF
jgi:hypothetical protein